MVMEIAIVLRQARIDAGLEQRELAQMMNVSAAFVSDLERGRRPFHDRYLDRLPEKVRPAVRAALVRLHEAQIQYLMKE